MILAGALGAALAVIAALAAVRRDSVIGRRLALLLPSSRRPPRWRPVTDRDLQQSRLVRTQTALGISKLLTLAGGAAAGIVVGAALGSAFLGCLALGYAGFVMPSLIVERRAAACRREADAALGALIERLEALTAAGRPVETALSGIAAVPSGSPLLDAVTRRAARAYALGAPLFRSLSAGADDAGLEGLKSLATELERARDLGRGSVIVVREARDRARARERTRSLEAAAKVEGRLMLTLVLCYLPALMLLVVIPLFLTLLDGLFG